MYLPVRHNVVAKVIYRMLTKLTGKATKEVYKNDEFEIWWDTKVSTKPTVKHNQPNMLLWRYQEKKVFIIDIVVGLDTNSDKNYASKLVNYLPLSVELKRLYTTYSFEIVPIVIGATGVIPKSLKKSLLKIGVSVNTRNNENTRAVPKGCNIRKRENHQICYEIHVMVDDSSLPIETFYET